MSASEAVDLAVAGLGGDSAFFKHYWDKRHGHVLSSTSNYTGHSALVAELSRFLDRTDIRYPSLRIVKDGTELPLSDYARELRLGPHISNDWIINEQVFAQYNAGATIVLQMLQHSVPAFGTMANSLEQRFQANLQLSCFITPPNSQGFTAHYDTYGFFAIQLLGTKRWSLYNSTPQLPVRDDRDVDDTWTPVPAKAEMTLTPGDVLFVPRGLYHSAKTSLEPSVHMTVGIFSPSWLDVLRDSLPRLQSQDRLRQSISEASDDELPALGTLIGGSLDLASGLKRTRDRVFDRHIDARANRLVDLLHLNSEKSDTFERQPIPFTLYSTDVAVHLRFCGKELEFPEFLVSLLEFVCESREPFVRQALPQVVDDESLSAFLMHLVLEGFIRPL